MKMAFVLLLLASDLLALDFTTLDGKTYKDCQVSRIFPDSICVLWSGGGARIKFENLPEAMRTRFAYDPGRAAAFQRAEAERQQRERTLLEAQRQFLENQRRTAAAVQTEAARTTPPSGNPNTGAQYVRVNMGAGNPAYNQTPNQATQFGGGGGFSRNGAQYVGVVLAGPAGGGIYGIGYGSTMRARP